MEICGIESPDLNGRTSSPVFTRGLESLSPSGRDAHVGRSKAEVVWGDAPGFLLG